MDDRTGLIWKFPINRALTAAEERDHLQVSMASCARPSSMQSTIRMNSTYLECCDKFYYMKGETTGMGIFIYVLCLAIMGSFVYLAISKLPVTPEDERGELLFFIITILVLDIATMLFIWLSAVSKEAFRYTHYPIRFNRKTRMVHVFRQDGTVMSEPWEKLYFTMGACKEIKAREVRMHRLAEDGKTVLETHALPALSGGDRYAASARAQWEFIRRYMETGPEAALPFVDHVLDAHLNCQGRRESFEHGLKMLEADTGAILSFLFFPLTLMYAIGRWVAMRISKQPVWPAEIEAECAIAPDDPCLVDAEHVPERDDDDDDGGDYDDEAVDAEP